MQKIQNMKSKKNVYQTLIAATLLLAVVGIFMPGWLLTWQSKEQMNMVDGVPAEYYSPANLAVARNASANLGVYQKLQLITGRWESRESTVTDEEKALENYEAVELAKEQMAALYQVGIYPVSLLSDYENWYSWEAEYCKVVDATFNTYAAYYWKLTFAKYDGSEKHLVYMLDDGTVFLAEAWVEDGIDGSVITDITEMGTFVDWGYREIVLHTLPTENQKITEYLTFTGIDGTDYEWMGLVQLRALEKEYYILQLQSDNRYLYSVQPLD